MHSAARKALEKRLVRETYPAIDEKLSPLSSSDLLSLLDSKSIKIGDTAAGILGRRSVVKLLSSRDAVATAGFIPGGAVILHYIGRAHFSSPPPGSSRWRQ